MAIFALGVVAAATAVWLILVALPMGLVGVLPAVDRLTDREYTQAVAEARTASLQLAAGLAVAGGLVFTAVQVRQRRAEHSAELFLNAIEKLADERVEPQLYAIHGLDRVADLSAADRVAVERILAQFVLRRQSEWVATERERHGPGFEKVKTTPLRLVDPAFQAAVETLGRRRRSPRTERLDLEGLSLTQPHFDGLDFGRVCLRNADLADGHFNGTSFAGSSLHNASLYGELRHADFRAADLRGAKITGLEGFADGVRLDGAWYNAMTLVEPVELAERLRRSGLETEVLWPLIEGCR